MTKAPKNTFAGLGSRPDTPETRDKIEKSQREIVDGRTLRRRNRAEQVAFKTTVEFKLLIQDLMQARGATMTEVIETALLCLKEKQGL